MTQILTLGEVLIDLTQTGTDEKGIPQFAAFPGGAPANVAVAASRLGAKTGFIGKIGSDSFGAQLRETLQADQVDTSYLFEAETVPTTLAIVSVGSGGERSFSFYRDPGADTQLTEEEAAGFLNQNLPFILHFGSLSLTTQPSRSAALEAARQAREKGVLISYDPNYRPSLWDSEEEAVRWMKTPLDMVDILKISDEELVLLTGKDDLEEGAEVLSKFGIRLVMITLGSKGVFYRVSGEGEGAVSGEGGNSVSGEGGNSVSSEGGNSASGIVAADKVSVCDTNGAGDTFLGAVLAKIAEHGSIPKDRNQLEAIMAFANQAAALTCSRAGAIPAMPTLDELGEQGK